MPSTPEPSDWQQVFSNTNPTCAYGSMLLKKPWILSIKKGARFMFVFKNLTKHEGAWMVIDHREDGFWVQGSRGAGALLKEGHYKAVGWKVNDVNLIFYAAKLHGSSENEVRFLAVTTDKSGHLL